MNLRITIHCLKCNCSFQLDYTSYSGTARGCPNCGQEFDSFTYSKLMDTMSGLSGLDAINRNSKPDNTSMIEQGATFHFDLDIEGTPF